MLVAPYNKIKVGGIGTWTKNIMQYNSSKFEVVLYNTAFSYKPNIVKNKFHRLFIGILDSIIFVIILFIKLIQVFPSTVHYTSSGSMALFKDYFTLRIALLFKIKLIIHWHFGRIPELNNSNNFEWNLLVRVAKLADHNIVLDTNSAIALNHVGINEVSVIPNPISKELQKVAEEIYSKELTNSTEFNIIYVGHIIPEKGIRELIEACRLLKFRTTLFLIGPVAQKFRKEIALTYESISNEFLKLVWVGEIKREAVFDYFRIADILCLPSYTEGFPNVIIEAMAFSCPVIATDVGAVKEMIASSDLGMAGICIERQNIEQLTDAINYIKSHPEDANKFGNNGKMRVLKKYTLDAIFHKYEELW